MAFIKSRDKDAGEDFDKDSPVGRINKKKKNNNLKRKLEYQGEGEASTSSGAKRSKRKASVGVKTAVKALAEIATDDSEEEEDPVPHWHPKKMEIGRKSGKLPLLKQELYYKCGVCKRKASPNSEYFWVYCPICLLINHVDCIERSCFCGFKPKPGQIKKDKTNKK